MSSFPPPVPPPPIPPPPAGPPPPPAGLLGGRWGKGCLIAGGVGCVLAVFACVGGTTLLTTFGMSLFGAQVMEQLKDNPAVVEHLGRCEDIDVDWRGSLSRPEPDIWAFRIQGTKGDGLVVVESVTEGDREVLKSGRMTLADGSVVDLFPDRPPGAASPPRAP